MWEDIIMKARNRAIALLVAVFMVLTMMPVFSQEALAQELKEVNMCNGVVLCGENVTVDLTEYFAEDSVTASVYAYFPDDEYKDYFTERAPMLYSWKAPDMYEAGKQFYIVIYSAKTRIESEWITIKVDINDLDFTGKISDKTYTGKKLGINDFEIDLGPIYFTKSNFKVSYSNNLNVGKATVKLTSNVNDLHGSRTLNFNIRPKGATIKTPSRSKTWIKVKWKAQKSKMSKSRITGYQVQYSTYSNFANAKYKTVKGYTKTSKKITGLSRKTKYYVRVRTYMTVKGVKYYSNWSKTKAVKTK